MDGMDSVSAALGRLITLVEQIRLGEDRTNDGSDPALATHLGSASEVVATHMLDGLALLRQIRTELAAWEPELITAARRAGASWTQLAPALGVASRQAAERRYLRLPSWLATTPPLLGPLAELRVHLTEKHPALAARLTDVAADAEQRRHRTVSDRHSTRPN